MRKRRWRRTQVAKKRSTLAVNRKVSESIKRTIDRQLARNLMMSMTSRIKSLKSHQKNLHSHLKKSAKCQINPQMLVLKAKLKLQCLSKTKTMKVLKHLQMTRNHNLESLKPQEA